MQIDSLFGPKTFPSFLATCFLSLLFLNSCASKTYLADSGLQLISESAYENLLDNYTDRAEKYQGLYNSLHMAGTLVNTKIAMAQVDQKARQFLWDATKYQAERNQVAADLKNRTELFLSFYAPEKKHDDLHKSNSMWKIFLDCEGRRFEGKATKIKLQTVEVQGLYSYHNKFSTPYSITFPMPTSFIDGRNVRLTLTGPAGSATLDFKP